MAKLKARGRIEIWKVARENPSPKSDLIVWEKTELTLMSDGRILKRETVRFKPGPYDGGKARLHDYGWKLYMRMKAEGSPSKLLEKLQLQGYTLIGTPNLDAFSTDYAKALEASKKGAAKRAVKVKETRAVEEKRSGPGYYVRNGTTLANQSWIAELGPYKDVDTAVEKAHDRYNEFRSMGFDYLLPVQVIHAGSRTEATAVHAALLRRKVHVFWENGKNRGPEVPEGQARFRF
jgi:hypothetical protein